MQWRINMEARPPSEAEQAMKISCYCGETVYDSLESNPDKAHMVSDAVYFPLLDQIDAAIESGGTSAGALESTCMKVRSLLSEAGRSVWQCQQCSRLYLGDPEGQLQCFQPQNAGTSSGVLGPPLAD